ncbi:3-phosphoshikimate 1-carboxyvinyltransferase [Alkalithermobacter thermoalcaliphilus JW-YL-7 = DSM 7308]|uniref:3-phosphoshikimate 1-carboxyvinyltransferase n=1 Tax=Alkalithermobacter thermoalcaliphilus JW-YL-7 = DSM 7308 TaxID=1121328 RepID=A0A150FPI3_CLOPD|nr:3-phosphoshikimate 1-carboxyvinyltransferase [[Clostridium] paradoxum JW-YL-7 = DSM 7308]SHL25309.1 3-phosphoshikimate 1-carboxyvinyltransferase [[Clostridium] paradoxum JW-YL-7 = DSM 7308]
MIFNPISHIKGEINLVGDKSISHRAIMLSSISNGNSYIENFLMAKDCLSTIDCFRKMGVDININKDKSVSVKGVGLRGLKRPHGQLDVGNSGTTIRLLMGILAGQNFEANLIGDSSIAQRPMKRVTDPLRKMGAKIIGKDDANFVPITIHGGQLKGIDYIMPIASAQVKSSIILASLYASSQTRIVEKVKSRNHTEIMLKEFGANINVIDNEIYINQVEKLYGQNIYVPADISSASFFICAASMLKGSEILIKNVGLNPTRTGILEVLSQMGGNFEVLNKKVVCGEIIGDLLVRYSKLKAIQIGKELIPKLIDEIPIIAVLATQCEGTTVIKDASELKVKESNRIKSVVLNLKAMGADIEELEDGMIINGPCKLKGTKIDSFNDHRIAMAFSIAALVADKDTCIDNFDCIDISFPEFTDILRKVSY